MKRSKVKIAAGGQGGVTKRGRKLGMNIEPNESRICKNKEPSSPNSNLENISPILSKRRKGNQQTLSPRTPKGRNGLRNSALDKSSECASSLEASNSITENVVESKIEEKEGNLDETQAESLRTPNNSLRVENSDAEKSDRQLRSSAKKVRSSFGTPVNKNKATDSVKADNVEEVTDVNTKKVADIQQNVSTGVLNAVLENKQGQLENPIESNNFDEAVTEKYTAHGKVVQPIEEQHQEQPAILKVTSQNEEHFGDGHEAVTDKSILNEAILQPKELKEQIVHHEQSSQYEVHQENLPTEEIRTSTVKLNIKSPLDGCEELKQEMVSQEETQGEILEENQKNLPTLTKNESLIQIDIKSPSWASVDSAKGSSIGTEPDSQMFFMGDLYWGQIHHFCYWPCMVCPDDTDGENSIIRMIEGQMEVHVRFFADNARHSWVKRENLLRYLGLKQYKELTNDAKEKYGENSPKCKIFFPKRSKKNIWRGAVKEADDMVNVPYAERLSTFFRVNDIARERIKEEKLRRKSLSITKFNQNLTVPNNLNSSDIVKKRNRSESPASPEFSPMKRETKRRKTTTATYPAELSQSERNGLVVWKSTDLSSTSSNVQQQQTQQQPQHNELFASPDFENLYDALKEFITRGFKCDPIIEAGIYRSVRNVWAMKQLVDSKIVESGVTLPLTPNNNGNKRLSSRLKDLQKRQHMQAMMVASPSPAKSPLEVTYPVTEKRRSSTGSIRAKNRPMTEVIDDIFNLDRFYLFDNVGGRAPVCKYCFKPGGVLKRCSKGCLSWFHADCSTDGKAEISTVNKMEAVSKLRLSNRKNSIKSFDLKSITHVTADDETTESDEEKQKLESSPENNGIKDSTVDLESPELLNVTKEEEPFECKECANDVKPTCFVCKNTKIVKSTETAETTENENLEKEELHMCNMANCGRSYHMSCLKYWPQAKAVLGKNPSVSLRCPSHSCHTCVSDDPKGKFQHLKDANTTKCVKCPATYHMDSTCIPAGSQVLTAAHIICPRHGLSKTDQMVNVSWCFICVRGGNLICCETCPTAVHAECTNVQLDANENYICDECESGRLPLYGEMVWAKFNVYRWWPAIILPPTEVPLNIRNKTHNPFDFVIRFFGTHDHGWISRRRVYLYVEGDWSEPPRTRRPIDQSYLRGVIEAKETYEIIKAKTIIRDTENENKDRLYPHPYVKIRVNRAIPPVKLHQDIEMSSKCGCDPNGKNPCGPDSNCLNRVLYHECNPKICPAGERCQNQMFESRISPALEIFYAKKERGFGLRCRENISSGTFIIEYVGEVINSEEFQRRMEQKSSNRDENYYFLYVEKDYIIDAGPKGNMARFMNHSCDPNCETQKWSVNGLNRVGLFAIKDIPAKTELTFNYHWDELLGNDKKICCCGSANCTGQIGKISKEEMKRKQEIETSKLSAGAEQVKTIKKRRTSLQNKLKRKKSDTLVPLNKKQKKSTKKKKRAAFASSTANTQANEPNDNNTNV